MTPKQKKAIDDFQAMRDTAELRALSKISLERPLTDREHSRMMSLAHSLGYE